MADHLRPSERTARDSETAGRTGSDHMDHARNEILAGFNDWGRGIVQRGQSIIEGTQENTHEVLEGGRRLLSQASHIPEDTVVRARRGLREAGQGFDREMDRRERELYPAAHPVRDTVVRVPQPTQRHDAAPAQRHDAAPAQRHDAAPAQRHDAAPARHADTTPPRANHDYVVRRGDNISSIVHRNEERLHPGTPHNMRREAAISQGLVDRYGERILEGMHIDLG